MLRLRPHVAVDLHEMGSSSSYFFPPPMAPVNTALADIKSLLFTGDHRGC